MHRGRRADERGDQPSLMNTVYLSFKAIIHSLEPQDPIQSTSKQPSNQTWAYCVNTTR